MTKKNLQELQAFLDSLSKDDVLVIDTETNWTDDYEDRYLMGIALCAKGQSCYLPVGHLPFFGVEPENVTVPDNLFSKTVAKLVFHNAKFDIQILERANVKLPTGNFYDTMMMAHYIDENELSYSLDNLCRVYKVAGKAGKIAKAMKDNWDNMLIDVMAQYAIQDVESTMALYHKLLPKFETYREVWEEVDREFTLLLAKMERKGILVDVPMCADLEKQCFDRMAQIEQELGFDPSKPSQLRSRLFDEPPFGLGLKPLSYTPKKNEPQVNKAFLEATNHPVCGLLLEYSELKKQMTSYFTPYQKKGGLAGRIHPSFKLHGTVTGRMSCENPNMQQVPRTSKVKDVFMPEKGCDLIEIDYSNIEMRLMAVYSQQPSLLEEFTPRKGDVHGRVASELGVDRFKAKTVNFLIGYGGGAGVLSKQLKISEREAKSILDKYKKTYKELFTTSYSAARSAEQNEGTVRLWSGRERHFKYPSEYHKAFNSVVQGGAFEIVKRSMLKLDAAGFDIRNQVHDSVWLNESDPLRVKEAERIMEEWVEELFGLPFYVESKVLRSRK